MKTSFPECTSCETKGDSLFHFCKLDELNKISLEKQCRTFKSGQTLFYEGMMPAALFCINSGKLKLHKQGSDGKTQIIRLIKPGDFVGYRALISDTPYSASATVLDEATVCIIPRRSFEQLLHDNDNFASNVMQLLCRNLAESESKLTQMAYKPVRERLAEALLLIRKTYDKEEKEPFLVNFSREDLAELVGTAKETVIRLLSEFKQEGIIKSEGRKIYLLDTKKLLGISNLYD